MARITVYIPNPAFLAQTMKAAGLPSLLGLAVLPGKDASSRIAASLLPIAAGHVSAEQREPATYQLITSPGFQS